MNLDGSLTKHLQPTALAGGAAKNAFGRPAALRHLWPQHCWLNVEKLVENREWEEVDEV